MSPKRRAGSVSLLHLQGPPVRDTRTAIGDSGSTPFHAAPVIKASSAQEAGFANSAGKYVPVTERGAARQKRAAFREMCERLDMEGKHEQEAEKDRDFERGPSHSF